MPKNIRAELARPVHDTVRRPVDSLPVVAGRLNFHQFAQPRAQTGLSPAHLFHYSLNLHPVIVRSPTQKLLLIDFYCGAGTITAPGSTFGIPKCPLMWTRSIGRSRPET